MVTVDNVCAVHNVQYDTATPCLQRGKWRVLEDHVLGCARGSGDEYMGSQGLSINLIWGVSVRTSLVY